MGLGLDHDPFSGHPPGSTVLQLLRAEDTVKNQSLYIMVLDLRVQCIRDHLNLKPNLAVVFGLFTDLSRGHST
jgi:hypothetical protein